MNLDGANYFPAWKGAGKRGLECGYIRETRREREREREKEREGEGETNTKREGGRGLSTAVIT